MAVSGAGKNYLTANEVAMHLVKFAPSCVPDTDLYASGNPPINNGATSSIQY